MKGLQQREVSKPTWKMGKTLSSPSTTLPWPCFINMYASVHKHIMSSVWVVHMRAYLNWIRQNIICKILINGYRKWRHLAHYARHMSHAATIEGAILQRKVLPIPKTRAKRKRFSRMYNLFKEIKIICILIQDGNYVVPRMKKEVDVVL